ncbi:hypothetical protein [Streptomyces sp. XD-27]|uniref:hypothetical protein n=1 Tax=Streptomyces sp. XD-27 TaxID=3062779 RepID=UPI0026F47C00|nr:hypothetical protein [Streptomyces sp. XD-27]WKX70878.1 hypothetical protein Q3Y56_14055 [Streptomyces sp. XD-27]
MKTRKSLALATATVALGSGLALAAPAAQAAEAPARTTAATAPQGDADARAWHRLWGPHDISQAELINGNGKWTSNRYRTPTSTTRAVLRCWNTREKMRVRIWDVADQRWVGSSGWTYCNPNRSMIAEARVNVNHKLRVRVEGDQGARVTTYYRG